MEGLSSFYRWDRVVPDVSKHGNFYNRLRGSARELPDKVGPWRKLPGIGRTPSSANPKVGPPSTAFRPVSSGFILRIFPRVFVTLRYLVLSHTGF
jgi:hypothetical protein